jgi:hypothetical protein
MNTVRLLRERVRKINDLIDRKLVHQAAVSKHSQSMKAYKKGTYGHHGDAYEYDKRKIAQHNKALGIINKTLRKVPV